MNNSMRDDFKRDGMFTQIMKRITDLEAFEREFRLKQFGSGGGGNYTLISDQVLAAGSLTITFSGISQSYKHLIMITNLRSNGATGIANVQFNGDASAVYSSILQFINNAAVGFIQVINGTAGDFCFSENAGGIANAFRPTHVTIPDYTGSTFKSWTGTGHAPGAGTTGNIYNFFIGGHWKNTAAITDIVLTEKGGGTFSIGSRATLYGLS